MVHIEAIDQALATDGASHVTGDAVGGRLKFANVGKYGYIVGALYLDLAGTDIDYDLVLFDRPFTAIADNSAFDPTDPQFPTIVAIVPLTVPALFADNGIIRAADGLRIPYKTDGGGLGAKEEFGPHLYGQLVARGTATPDASANVVRLFVERDFYGQ